MSQNLQQNLARKVGGRLITGS